MNNSNRLIHKKIQQGSNVINAGNNADFFATEQTNLFGVTSANGTNYNHLP